MTFRFLPIFGCIRNRGGVVLDVTDRLAQRTGLTREQIIGRRAVEIWSHMADSIALDLEALQSGKPVEQFKRSPESGTFWRSVHTPDGDAVVWVGEDESAEVKLDAVMALLRSVLTSSRPVVVDDPAQLAALLHNGADAEDIATHTGLSYDRAIGTLVRSLSSR